MGLRKIFDNSASFGRILEAGSTKPGQGIFVSGILQKAGIEVNEEGSTAYVATGNKKYHINLKINIIINVCFCRNRIRKQI